MRRVPFLLSAALMVATVVPATVHLTDAAGAVPPTSSRLGVVNAFTYDASSPGGSVSLCVNGANYLAGLAAGDTSAGAAVDVGSATIGISSGNVADPCAAPEETAIVTVPATDFSTLMVYGQPNGGTLSAVVFAEDDTCLAPGTSRLVVRHAADDTAVDIHATPPSGTDTTVLRAVAQGGEGSVDLATGSYTAVRATGVDDPSNTRISIGTVDLPVETAVVMYLWGGFDGTEGSFSVTRDLNTCAVTTTSTTLVSTSTTAPAAATAAVATTPQFTG